MDSLLKKVQKRFGAEVFANFAGGELPVDECLSTGFQPLDDILTGSTTGGTTNAGTGKGFPYGRVVELWGPEGIGKTTFTLTLIRAAQQAGEEAAFIDAEHSLDLNLAEAIGVDMDRLLYSQPSSAEEALELVRTFAKDGTVRLIIVDSTAGLVPEDELNTSLTKDSPMAAQARLLSAAFRRTIGDIKKSSVIVVFISQVRAKIGAMAFGPKTQPTGGSAIRFYASFRLELYNKGALKNKSSKRIGSMVAIKCVKNKVAPPFREVYAENHFGKGFVKMFTSDEDVAREDV